MFNRKIIINLDDLDLNYQPTITPPKWEPTTKLRPYQELVKLYLDIETTGLNPEDCRVIMVGLRDQNGENACLYHDDEKQLLNMTMALLSDSFTPDILVGHNLFDFDLPFLMKRCEIHGVEHCFEFGREKTVTSASLNGKPITFTDILFRPLNRPRIGNIQISRECKPIEFREPQIVDTMHQIAVWDKSNAKLMNYKLKQSVLTIGLRKEKRLELSHEEIQNCYQQRDFETIKKYLVYDLEDTELLANFLIPVIYYQMLFVPKIELQDLAVGSPAIKAQKIHESLLPNTRVEADDKQQYEGATVGLYKAGLHRNIAKIDVTSLYPSIMLRYGICSRKDPQHKFLGVLDYMRNERLKQKKLVKTAETEEERQKADHQQNALKILINGSYGYFGTGGYSFNDYNAAAKVTAYGRKILQLMENNIVKHGGELVESDTDGIIFISMEPDKIFDEVSKVLPSGIVIELDYRDCIASVPKAKNYTILKPDGKVVTKGSKRSELDLIKEFRIDYLKAYAKSELDAQRYYQNLLDNIESGNYPLEKLTITRKIAVSEKKLVEMGLGKLGEIITYWYGYDYFGKCGEVKEGKYYPQYYINKVKETKDEIVGLIEEDNGSQQLSLFE